ncbi:MAG: nicotinate (nicotinamide) nucleotide adenylyltransferase [Dehalococcoidia bacterium]
MASFDRLEAPRAGTRLERHGVKPGDRVRIGSVDSTGRLTPYEIGVLGGTFDPPHLGHLRLAEVAREHLRLDVVVFVPAGNPYRKAAQKGTPAHLRVRLLRAALEGMAWAEVSTVEVDTPGPSYSDETLALLAAARPGIDTGWWFIAGSDVLADLPHWHDPRRLVELARLAIAPRAPGGRHVPAATLHAIPGIEGRIDWLPLSPLDVSSTVVRNGIAAGDSSAGVLNPRVRSLIEELGLYR